MRLIDFKQGLDRTKNTPIVLKAKLGIKFKVIMPSFISRLSLGQKSVAGERGGLVVYASDSGSRGRGFEPHSGQTVLCP